MSSHSTCTFNTFITAAPDCAAPTGIEPPVAENPSITARTFAIISEAPYEYTSDDVIFTVWADRMGIPASDRPAARDEFFSKGRPCMRASDLGKKYGWGVHSDSDGRVALYPVGSAEYESLANGTHPESGEPVTVTAAMRSKKR